jgi:hypothetical protein
MPRTACPALHWAVGVRLAPLTLLASVQGADARAMRIIIDQMGNVSGEPTYHADAMRHLAEVVVCAFAVCAPWAASATLAPMVPLMKSRRDSMPGPASPIWFALFGPQT